MTGRRVLGDRRRPHRRLQLGGGASPSTRRLAARPPRARRRGELTIFAAASLGKALEQVETAYEAANPGTTLTISTDSSSALATQIEQGAPADVFLSADTTNPQKLVDGGFADGDAVTFAGNKLDDHHADRQPGRPRRPVRARDGRGPRGGGR